jgi:hypothetical protein
VSNGAASCRPVTRSSASPLCRPKRYHDPPRSGLSGHLARFCEFVRIVGKLDQRAPVLGYCAAKAIRTDPSTSTIGIQGLEVPLNEGRDDVSDRRLEILR